MLKSRSDLSRVVKGISFSWVKFVLSILIGVFQTPLLFKHLPTEQLNTWYIFFSLGAFLQISDLGLVSSISRIISYLDNSNSGDSVNDYSKFKGFSIRQIYSTSLFSFAFILSLVAFVVFQIVTNLGNSSLGYDDVLRNAFVIFIGGVVFNMLSNVPTAVLAGYRDVGYDSLVRSITQVLYFLSLIFLLPIFPSIQFVALAFLGQNLLQFIVLHIIMVVRFSEKFAGRIELSQLLKFNIVVTIYRESFPLALNQVGTWLTTQGSVFIASIAVGSEKISDYAINQQLFTYGLAISLVINQSIGPFVAKQFIQGNQEALRSYFIRATTVSLGIISLFLVCLLSVFDDLISLWVGIDHSLGINVVVFFALIIFFEVQHSVAGNFVWNMGSWPFNKLTLLAGILNLSLGFLLGSQFGLLGIAIATFVSKFSTLNWYVVYTCLRKLKLGAWGYLKDICGPIAFSVLVTLLLSGVAKRYLIEDINNQFVKIIMTSAMSIVIFLSLILVFFKRTYQPFVIHIKSFKQKLKVNP